MGILYILLAQQNIEVSVPNEKYQEEINIIIGKHYPSPIVIHKNARAGALKAFQSLKKN